MEHEAEGSAELSRAEREALWAWAQPDVPADFSARVGAMAAATRRPDEPRAEPAPRSRRAWLWTGAIALAAAVLATLWLAHDVRRDGVDASVIAVGSEPPPDLVLLRDDVRVLLAEHCVPCHSRDAGGAEPKALAVFEVSDEKWAGRLSDAQIEGVRDRFAGMGLDEEIGARVDGFVTRELQARSGGAG